MLGEAGSFLSSIRNLPADLPGVKREVKPETKGVLCTGINNALSAGKGLLLSRILSAGYAVRQAYTDQVGSSWSGAARAHREFVPAGSFWRGHRPPCRRKQRISYPCRFDLLCPFYSGVNFLSLVRRESRTEQNGSGLGLREPGPAHFLSHTFC